MAKWIFVLCVLTFSEIGCGEISQHYDDHTLVRLYPENMKQLEVIKHVGRSKNMDVLKYSRGLNDSTDLLVPGEKMRIIQEMIDTEHLEYDTKEHYGRLFDRVNRVPKRRSGSSFSVYEYHSYNAIRDHLEVLAKKYPDLMNLQTLGTSFQGRRMKLVKISTNPNGSNPIIFVDAGIHGREWVAPAMAVYLIQRLVSDPSARSELAGLDWYILPVVNPDGYEYTRTSKANRLWRKTRSKPSGYDCFGVDGNRNYDYKWAVSGVSNNPCDGETYAGPKPFSELETQMVRNVMMENKKRLKLYVSLHSYGNYLVYPWGYTGDILPKEWRRLDTLAKNVAGAIYRAGGDHLTVMSAGKWYPAAGGSDDYAFGAVGVPYSYTMELTKGYEFIFPERLLKEVLPQYYIGFRVFANQIKKEFSNGVRREKGCSVLGTYLPEYEAKCGCKFMRECYKIMLDHLQSAEEEACVENVPVSTATVTVFLHALHKHCGDVIKVKKSGVSYEGRTLYEVVINGSTWGNRSRSVVIVDAGQDANEAPVGFALYLIEQLVACSEYRGMVEHVRWVILPSTNPDGLEYSRTKREYWRKNTRLINDLSYGVDITRNFEVAWSDCSNSTNSFSQEFPGPEATSENETIFIKNIIQNYSELTRAYISFRRDGHGIFYPLASKNSSDNGTEIAKEIAGYIASKVNHEMFLHLFQNDSIYNVNAKPLCGHSVDYVFKTFAIPCAFEMRMFLESSNEIMSKLHRMPKGYVSSLRAQYFNGIKELYKHIRKTS